MIIGVDVQVVLGNRINGSSIEACFGITHMTTPNDVLPLEIVEETRMTAELDLAIRTLLCNCFPENAATFRETRAWQQSVPEFSVIARQDNTVVGHVAVVHRRISCSRGKTVDVAGIQGVAVGEPMRGTGLSHRLLDTALQQATRHGLPFGLLFCRPMLERFYASLGWRRTDQPITIRDADNTIATLPHTRLAMYIPLSDRPFPEGPLDLRGRRW